MRSVIIGVFDGVHRGHQELIARASEFGDPIALTFFPHPTSVFAPERTPTQLLSIEDRVHFLLAAGIKEVIIKDFTKEFASLTPDQFIESVLKNEVKATHVTVGENFTFGVKASGSAKYLEAHSGIATTILSLQENRGSAISSTRIRNLIIDGDVDRAKELLTRPHRLRGLVVHGEKRGRTIGYPTANIAGENWATIPADGVYAGWLSVNGKRWASAISIGTNPTFPGVRGRQIEAYAIGQSGLDLYDQNAILEFGWRLRDTLKFDSLEELLVQMKLDCAKALELCALG
jgi:riboflavin kinase / FMN adenylyltransferase